MRATDQSMTWHFRAALFAAAVGLAACIPSKCATQFHAISGLYAGKG